MADRADRGIFEARAQTGKGRARNNDEPKRNALNKTDLNRCKFSRLPQST